MLGLTCPGANALRFFLLGLFKGRLEFGSELEFIFEQTPELCELSPRKLVQLSFDLLDFAHASNDRFGAGN